MFAVRLEDGRITGLPDYLQDSFHKLMEANGIEKNQGYEIVKRRSVQIEMGEFE